mmetsp:Transcript_46985/g.60380  ORF Transcript_46985/g.60380 Transcript_46985/m.60380 type:complete len:745 (+) Transcript_46985:112-2346(+)
MPEKKVVAQQGLVAKPPWVLRKSKRHEGRWYFFNSETKASAWSLPDNLIKFDDPHPEEPDEPPPEVVAISSSGSSLQFPSIPSNEYLHDHADLSASSLGDGWNTSDRYQRTSREGINESNPPQIHRGKPAPPLSQPSDSDLFSHRHNRNKAQSNSIARSSSVQCMGSTPHSLFPQHTKQQVSTISQPVSSSKKQNEVPLAPIDSAVTPRSPEQGGWGGGGSFAKSQSTDSFNMSTLQLPDSSRGSLLGKETERRLRLTTTSTEDLPNMPLSTSEMNFQIHTSNSMVSNPPQLSPTLPIPSPRHNSSNTTSPTLIDLESPRTELDDRSTYSMDSNDSNEDEGESRFKVTNGLGSGGYSVVVLVEDVETSHPYAMKVIQKSRLSRSHDRRRIRNELKVLRGMPTCPFLEKCVSAFETKDRIFFVMEFNSGGDLFYHLVRRVNKFNTGFKETEVRTLLAEVLLGLEHMHSHGYVHRDIKVENIMLDSRGHVKLIDFGLVFELKHGKDLRPGSLGEPMSPTGSLIYMAPELLQYRMGGKHTDWWAFGVLAHELLTGRTPWSSLTNKKIIQKEISGMRVAPPAGISPSAGMFICSLLHQNPELRLGTNSSVRSSSFFATVDWEVAKTVGLPPALPVASSSVYSGGLGTTFDADETSVVLQAYLSGCEKEHTPGQCVVRVSAGRDPIPTDCLFSLGLPRVNKSPVLLTKEKSDGLTWDEEEGDLRLRRSSSITGDNSWSPVLSSQPTPKS